MIKKAIVGVAAVGVIIALRPAAGRISQKVREHCEQMASKCKQIMATQPGQRGAAGMREHCKEMMGAHGGHGETAEPREPSQQEAPQFAGHEEVAV